MKPGTERGQSTVEFVLMMPVLFAAFFWIVQANIFMTGMHQTAYASYAGARALIVTHKNQPKVANIEQDVVRYLMQGKIWTEARQGLVYVDGKEVSSGSVVPVKMKKTKRGYRGNDSKYAASQADGVEVDPVGFGKMPYVRSIMAIDTKVPTHLGPDEWDRRIYTDNVRDQDNRRNTETDNNGNDS